jgi:hypothetical protein
MRSGAPATARSSRGRPCARRRLLGPLDIEVDPLVVWGQVREPVDRFLRDLEPVADPELQRHPERITETAVDQLAEAVLRLLGAPASEAGRLAALPLPPNRDLVISRGSAACRVPVRCQVRTLPEAAAEVMGAKRSGACAVPGRRPRARAPSSRRRARVQDPHALDRPLAQGTRPALGPVRRRRRARRALGRAAVRVGGRVTGRRVRRRCRGGGGRRGRAGAAGRSGEPRRPGCRTCGAGPRRSGPRPGRRRGPAGRAAAGRGTAGRPP